MPTLEHAAGTDAALAEHPIRPAAAPLVQSPPNEPERSIRRELACVPPSPPTFARSLHEPAASWLPKEPERGGSLRRHYLPIRPAAPGRGVHQAAARSLPDEPEAGSGEADALRR